MNGSAGPTPQGNQRPGNGSSSSDLNTKILSVYTNTRDSAALSVIEKHVRPTDYVIGPSSPLSRANPAAKKIAASASLDGIPQAISMAKSKGIQLDYVVYDPEHWPQTPQEEQQDIAGSVSKAANTVHAAGLKFGITPDRPYLMDNYQNIDWRKVDYLNMQLQRDLASPSNYTLFTSEVKKVSEFARGQNPDIEVFVQISFRFADAESLIKAVDMTSVYVDGFVVAYLPNGPCPYCSVDNLEAVLAHIHKQV